MIPIKDENPTETFPFVTLGLIGANILVFTYQLSLGANSSLQQNLIYTFGLVPYKITHASNLITSSFLPYLSVFTSMFLHGGFVHILGNMLYLWIFGNNVEDTLGHIRFLLFYLLCGVGGAAGHILISPNSQVPTIGASGAIAGILGAYLLLFPHARIITVLPLFYFIEIVRLPAVIVIGFWFVLQLLSGVASIASEPQISGGIAWFAHIGGFLAGVLLVLIMPKRRKTYRENLY